MVIRVNRVSIHNRSTKPLIIINIFLLIKDS
jgi:hypothetical protein